MRGKKGQLLSQWKISKFTYNMSISFEAANEEHDDRLKIILRMPDRNWFSIGFGSDMTDTDMIAWHADGEASYVKDYWSTKKDTPKEDDV